MRVVITGMGVISPLGNNVAEMWESMLAGKSGIGPVTRFDASDFSTRIAAEVNNFDPTDYIEKKEARHMDPFTQFAVAAARQAFTQSAIDLEHEDRERMGVIVGSGIGGLSTIEEQIRILHEKGPRRVSPFMIPMLIANMASGYISIDLGLKGPNSTIVTACATGTHSIGEAFKLIQRGIVDVMIAGGAEAAITPIGFAGFCSARAMSTRNDDPDHACRPFDLGRDGFVMGEGAGVVVLESLEHAVSRGAEMFAEVVGYGLTGDAYHITAPDPEASGAARCMAMAINDAGLSPDQVDYINAHGTSTEFNDRIETMAIKKVFGDAAAQVAVSSTKSMTGHMLGAAGGVEAIVCALALRDGIIPPTINYQEADPECDLDYVPNRARKQELTYALSNSFGFGGTNASLLLKKIT